MDRSNAFSDAGPLDDFHTRCVSRRAVLTQLSLLSATVLVGCSPLRILFKSYPEKFDTDRSLEDRFLSAFVTAVIPTAPQDEPNLIRIYTDTYYPFHRFRGFFVSDLARRSRKLCGRERFDQLTAAERTRVIQSGLDADRTVARLYRGAILMAQVSFFAGIYDDRRGCPQIGFYGSEMVGTEPSTYPDSQRFLAREATHNGNFS